MSTKSWKTLPQLMKRWYNMSNNDSCELPWLNSHDKKIHGRWWSIEWKTEKQDFGWYGVFYVLSVESRDLFEGRGTGGKFEKELCILKFILISMFIATTTKRPTSLLQWRSHGVCVARVPTLIENLCPSRVFPHIKFRKILILQTQYDNNQ